MFTLTVELDTLSHFIQNLPTPPAHIRRRALDYAASVLMGLLQKRFGYQVSYDGQSLKDIPPLAPLTLAIAQGEARQILGGGRVVKGDVTRPTYVRRSKSSRVVQRTSHSRPLINTGQLRASLLSGVYHVKTQLGSDEIIIGTRAPYARFLHEGATVRVDKRIRLAIGLRSGIWLKEGTVLHTPPRPFLKPTKNEIALAEQAYFEWVLKAP